MRQEPRTSVFQEGSSELTKPGLFWISEHKETLGASHSLLRWLLALGAASVQGRMKVGAGPRQPCWGLALRDTHTNSAEGDHRASALKGKRNCQKVTYKNQSRGGKTVVQRDTSQLQIPLRLSSRIFPKQAISAVLYRTSLRPA